MKNKIYFSTFNLYKGGSLTIYNAIKPFFKKDQEVVEFNPPYPFFINSLNPLWRIIVEQIFISFLSFKTNKLLIFGNVPCVFFVGKQIICFHNINYLREDWRYLSIQNRLEYYYFYFINKFCLKYKNISYFVQTRDVMRELKLKFKNPPVKISGSPFDKENFLNKNSENLKFKNIIKKDCKSFKRFFLYPAYVYENKNHILLSKVCAKVKKDYDINIVFTETKKNFGNLKAISFTDSDYIKYYYEKCEGLIFPSLYETFGYPLIEAALLSKPIIAINRNYVKCSIKNFYAFDNDEKSLLKAFAKYNNDYKKNSVRVPKIISKIDPSDFINFTKKSFNK
jgi:hypothetical protein